MGNPSCFFFCNVVVNPPSPRLAAGFTAGGGRSAGFERGPGPLLGEVIRPFRLPFPPRKWDGPLRTKPRKPPVPPRERFPKTVYAVCGLAA